MWEGLVKALPNKTLRVVLVGTLAALGIAVGALVQQHAAAESRWRQAQEQKDEDLGKHQEAILERVHGLEVQTGRLAEAVERLTAWLKATRERR